MFWTTLISLTMTRMVCNVGGTQYIFFNQSETWNKAREVCSENGLRLASFNENSIESKLQNCSLEGVTDLWTDMFMYTTPYISLVGCSLKNNLPTQTHKADSIIECQISCEEHPRFAIRKTDCACLTTDSNLGTPLNNARCNYTCEDVRCGGRETVSVYEIVKGGSVVGEQKFSPNVSLSCLVYQCTNNSITYEEEDCREYNITLNTDYFSCTFEPEDDCFLVQPTWNDFVWSVQNTSIGKFSAYEPSYYAYVNATGSNPNQTATLISINSFKAANWCLRFRYLASLATSLDVTLLDIIQDKNESLINIRNATKTSITEPDWYYVEVNIIRENDFNLMFSFEESNESSNIALDDVSMIAGYCNETLTELLNQRGELQCTFGGNTDMCFRQDNMNDTADWVYIDNNAYFYQGAYQSSVLISAFELQDVSVHICVRYYTVGGSSLILSTDLGDRKLPNTITTTAFCTKTPLSIAVKSKLYINGTLSSNSFSEIAIIYFKITIIKHSYNYQSKTTGAQQKPVPDPLVLSTADLSNVRCISDGPHSYTNTIRLQGKYLPKNGIPSAVLVYRTYDSTVNWEEVKNTTKRLFICEKDTGVENSCKAYFPEKKVNDAGRSSEEKEIVWIIVIVAFFIIVLTMLVAVVVFKREYIKDLCEKNTSTVQTDNTPNLYLDVIKSTSSYETLEATRNNTAEGTYEHLHPEPATMTPDNEYSYITENAYENR
uniref:Uncharacterized protein LOC111112884 n=1 Tax=Crassostrea virginica TaxID=6565 RepID=A0A8B8BT34_CRAVI|nr:uncharacterized protein LOC111112884 [Crassostrea virginica]